MPTSFARACSRYGVLVVGEEMKGLMPNGLTDGPRTNTDNGGNCPEMSGATVSDRHLPFQSSRSRQSYRVVGGGADPVDGPLRPTARLSAIGRQKYARATSQPFRRAAGVLRPVRARRGARLKLK